MFSINLVAAERSKAALGKKKLTLLTYLATLAG